MPQTIYSQLLANCRATFKDTSYDPTHKEYMTESPVIAVNFDQAKNDYVEDLRLPESPKSCDALYFHHNGTYYLVEFKNGGIDNLKCYEIKMKILDSLLILLDQMNKTVSFSRENLSYILVYNEDCPHTSRMYNQVGSSRVSAIPQLGSTSPGQVDISKIISNKAGEHFIRFGLKRYESIYFKAVYTYTKKEFQDHFISTC